MDLESLKETPPWDWPEGAGNMLLKILADREADESRRLVAVELAGDPTVISDEIVDGLLSVSRSRDEPERLRAMAAISLGPILEQADMDGFEDRDSVPIAEATFRRIQESLRELYMDAGVPKEVRRRVLESSVRAPQDWHQDVVRAAYAGTDEDWKLTALFSMRWVRGFEEQILEALDSENEGLLYQALCAAGNWGLAEAWPRVSGLVSSGNTEKELLLAAIDATVCIRPEEAGETLVDLLDSGDEEVVEAVHTALALAGELTDELDEDPDRDGEEAG